MRVLSIFTRGIVQATRDKLTLILTLFTTPLFIFFYWFFLGTNPKISIGYYIEIDSENPIYIAEKNYISKIFTKWEKESPGNFKIQKIETLSDFKNRKKNNNFDISINIKIEKLNEDLSLPKKQKINITLEDIAGTEHSANSLILAKLFLDDYFLNQNEIYIVNASYSVEKKNSKILNHTFALFVPGFLVFSVMMILFSTTIAVTNEIESGVFLRYILSDTPISEFLLGNGLVQFFNAVISIIISTILASLLGFDFQGKIFSTIIICILGALACIGIGLFISAFMKSSSQAFLSSSFVMFILLLFSGIAFPMPVAWIVLPGIEKINFFSLLPTSLLKNSLELLLFSNKNLADLIQNILLLTGSMLFYFTAGVLFFKRIYKVRLNL
ncbi:MAG: ABC transporter permease [Leptospira sp.]|nr:ABC transporter permease [Leptospira sp.]